MKKNLSEEDKDMIVNEISLVIQNIILPTGNMLSPDGYVVGFGLLDC